MATTPEGRVKAGIKKLLSQHGIFYYMPVNNGMGRVGAADFLCVYKGAFLAIEAKAPGKKSSLTPNQKNFLDEVMAHGGMAVVVDSVAELSSLIGGDKSEAGGQRPLI